MNDISFIHNWRICLGVPFFRLQVFERLEFNFLKYFKRPSWKLVIFCLVKGLTGSNEFFKITSGVALPFDYFLIT